jgi:phosphate transport system protein
MNDKHLSTQFDAELSGISNRVLEMGGLVESQVSQALYALTQFSTETARQVLQQEERVNQMEVEIDRDLSAIIARRQPTARDLRLLIAISKTIANLERVGDEAARIARTVQRLINTGVSTRLPVATWPLVLTWRGAAAQGAGRLCPPGHGARRWKCSSRTTRSTRSSKACCAS